MPFFARPNLDNDQFKQIQGTTLTLSGETQIATVTGLTLTDGIGGYIPIVATGATDNYVLTYLNNKISLQPVSGVTGNAYSGMSPTTCTVGGLISGSSISNCSFTSILQSVLVPPLNPIITSPSSSFSIYPANTEYEVGTCVCIAGYTTFDRGCVNPVYSCTTSDKRSGNALCYLYSVWGNNCTVVNSSTCNPVVFTPYSIVEGANNILSSTVCYASGNTIFNSQNGIYVSGLTSGTTPTSVINITGIYPFIYGKFSSGCVAAGLNRPSPTAALISNGTSVVTDSSSTICVNFNSTSDDYIWFATPASSPDKICWYVDSANNGSIGGSVSVGGNLFPSGVIVSSVCNPTSSCGCWSGQTYKIYVSNYQTTSNKIIEFRNN